MKRCNKCGETKPLDRFSKNKDYSDGKQNRCKDCAKEYRAANAERLAVLQRENYMRNRNERLAKNREYYQRNSEKIIAQKHEYNQANPHVKRKASLKRRAKQHENGLFKISDKDMRKLYSSPCVYCGSFEQIQGDHIIPVIRGGIHAIGNLNPCCHKCNPSKGERTIMEWRISKIRQAKID